MGGPPTPGTGWAAGVERLAMLIEEPPPPPRPIAIVPIGEAMGERAIAVAQRLRGAGFVADLGYSGNVGKRLKRANKIGARAAVLLGEDELARDAATVRDLDTGDQVEVPLSDLVEHLARYQKP
jgi:histidyl-tRNA synthetase